MSDKCHEYDTVADGTVLRCTDLYARDSTLSGCPAHSVSSPYNNPASRYSIRCDKTGDCPQLRNLYIQYPANQISDDVLELTAWSRADWQGASGFQRSRLNVNVLVAPSLSVSAAGFSVEPVQNCDVDTIGNHTCATGLYRPPLQPRQAVTIVPASMPPITISVSESDLDGVRVT